MEWLESAIIIIITLLKFQHNVVLNIIVDYDIINPFIFLFKKRLNETSK